MRLPAASRCRAAQAQPRRERRDQCDAACRDQDAVTAVGKIEPQAAAGRKPAERRAKTLQPLQPDGAVGRQSVCEPRDLPPVPIGRSKSFFGQRGGIGCAEQPGAGRIGPQDLFAVGRPQPCGQGTRSRRPPVADRRPRAPEIPHHSSRLHDRPASISAVKNQTAPGNRSIASAKRQVHGPAGPASLKAADNPNPADIL